MTFSYTKTPNAIYAALADMSEAEMRVTFLKPLAMDRFRPWLHGHGLSLPED